MTMQFHPPRDGANDADDSLLHLASLVALGGMLALCWRACSAKHQHRRSARSARAPDNENTWEGEGGRPLPGRHDAE